MVFLQHLFLSQTAFCTCTRGTCTRRMCVFYLTVIYKHTQMIYLYIWNFRRLTFYTILICVRVLAILYDLVSVFLYILSISLWMNLYSTYCTAFSHMWFCLTQLHIMAFICEIFFVCFVFIIKVMVNEKFSVFLCIAHDHDVWWLCV